MSCDFFFWNWSSQNSSRHKPRHLQSSFTLKCAYLYFDLNKSSHYIYKLLDLMFSVCIGDYYWVGAATATIASIIEILGYFLYLNIFIELFRHVWMFLARGISKWQVYIWSQRVLPFAVEVFVLLHLGAQITLWDLSVTTTVTRTTQIANDEHTRSDTIMITATVPEKYK